MFIFAGNIVDACFEENNNYVNDSTSCEALAVNESSVNNSIYQVLENNDNINSICQHLETNNGSVDGICQVLQENNSSKYSNNKC